MMDTKLSQELIMKILDHLCNNGPSLKSLSATCKLFHSIESSHRTSAKLLTPSLLPRVLQRYPNLLHIDLSLCPIVNDSLLHTVASYGLSLTSLKIASCLLVKPPRFPTLLELDLSNATLFSDSAAGFIAAAPLLKKLTLVRCKVLSDVGVGCISVGCSKLEFVSLKWCLRVSDFGVTLLARNCRLLRSLDLSFLPITEKCIFPILQLPYLEDFTLVGCLGLDDDGLGVLKDGCATLRTLDISNCQNISHTGLAHITKGATGLEHLKLAYASAVTLDVAKCLQSFSMLNCLKLDGCVLTSSALKMIGNWSGSLGELSLSKCVGVTDEGISCIVRCHTQLRKLDITCCRKITSISIDSITRSCTALTCLKMEACSLVSKEAFSLIGQRCLLLEELDVTDDNIDDEGLKSISRCSRLLCLKLGICLTITAEGLTHIGLHCSKLKEIDLYRAIRITDIGIASIAHGCSSLELINIAYCDQLTDDCLISLSKCWSLKALEARGCSRITSEGVAAIAVGCRQLQVLDVKKCFKINNSGMIPLAHYCQSLKQINLSYCSVTDLGLLALASISPLQNMTILHLAGLSTNGLTAALLGCRGLKKVKLHASFKALLPQGLIDLMESRGCVLQWRDKAFQPQVDTDPLQWNLQTGVPS